MRVVALFFAIALVAINTPLKADPFTFVFTGTLHEVNLPGAVPAFELRVTVDNGGQTPVGTFQLNDWVRYELISGTYMQVWDREAGGGFSGCLFMTCMEVVSDGLVAQLVVCGGEPPPAQLPDDASLCGAQDNVDPTSPNVCLTSMCGSTGIVPGLMVSSGNFAASIWHPSGQTFILEGVVARQAPDCSVAHASIAGLWPPDQRMVAVSVSGVVDPDGDPVTIEIVGVTSDESADGTGSGGTCPDATIDGDHVLLRAERAGQGNGRVYTVHFTATDPSGSSCTGSVDVCVPHDRRSLASCINDVAFAVDATSCTAEKPKQVDTSIARVWLSRRSGSDLEINFSLPSSGLVELAMYDLRGRHVRLLTRRYVAAGKHAVFWSGVDNNGREVPAGVYLVRLTTEERAHAIKVPWVSR